MRGLLIAGLIGISTSFALPAPPDASSAPLPGPPSIWFAPLDFLDRPEVGYSGSSQYMDLFAPGSPWAHAASHVRVFKIYPQWIGQAKDDDLRRMFADLDRRGIALALEFGALTASNDCGHGVEGFGGQTLVSAARRVQRNGGRLQYVAMDEPIFFSTIYDGKNACRWTVNQMAANAAANVRALRAEFPDVQVGDIEPVPAAEFKDWLARYQAGMDALGAAFGFRLAFFDADVEWIAGAWPQALDALRNATAERGIPFGVIYNGNVDDRSDLAWVRRAEQHMVEYELGAGPPDRVIFQSWHPYPKKLLPETDGDSFTNLINRYFRARVALTSRITGSSAEGALTLADGTGLPGAPILITATPVAGPGRAALYEQSGTLPPGVQAIVMGVRVNLECACSGRADVVLTRFRFETDTGTVIDRNFTRGSSGWGVSNPGVVSVHAGSLHIVAGPNQRLLLNSPAIPIRAATTFRFMVSAQVAPVSGASGYFTVVFLRDGGREISRVRIPMDVAAMSLGTVRTGSDGRWSFNLGAQLGSSGGVRITASYPGNDQYWPARATMPY